MTSEALSVSLLPSLFRNGGIDGTTIVDSNASASDIDESPTYKYGFGWCYNEPQSHTWNPTADPTLTRHGIYPTRDNVNDVFAISSSMPWFNQCGGIVGYSKKVCDAIGGYPQGAVLGYYDADKNVIRNVMSLIPDNKVDFTKDGVDGINWTFVNSSQNAMLFPDFDLEKADLIYDYDKVFSPIHYQGKYLPGPSLLITTATDVRGGTGTILPSKYTYIVPSPYIKNAWPEFDKSIVMPYDGFIYVEGDSTFTDVEYGIILTGKNGRIVGDDLEDNRDQYTSNPHPQTVSSQSVTIDGMGIYTISHAGVPFKGAYDSVNKFLLYGFEYRELAEGNYRYSHLIPVSAGVRIFIASVFNNGVNLTTAENIVKSIKIYALRPIALQRN